MTYGRRPARRCFSASSAMTRLRSAYICGVMNRISAPISESRNRLPSRSAGSSPRRNRRLSIPRRRAAMAVARQWFDWTPPHVKTRSAPSRSASARRNSSLRTLLPERSLPVSSSRLTKSSGPSALQRSSRCTRVGRLASATRGGSRSEGGIIASEQVRDLGPQPEAADVVEENHRHEHEQTDHAELLDPELHLGGNRASRHRFQGDEDEMPSIQDRNRQDVEEADVDADEGDEDEECERATLGAVRRKLGDEHRSAQILDPGVSFEQRSDGGETELQAMLDVLEPRRDRLSQTGGAHRNHRRDPDQPHL